MGFEPMTDESVSRCSTPELFLHLGYLFGYPYLARPFVSNHFREPSADTRSL